MRVIRPKRRGGTGGFTLIELTLSAALMALILASAYACLNAGMSAQRLLEPRLDAMQGARVALGMMAADLRSACPLEAGVEFIGMDRTLGEAEADNLDFATLNHTPRRPGDGDYCQASYYLDQDRETGELVLWRRRHPRIGLDPFQGGQREEILRGVRTLNFQYFDGFDWYDTWEDSEGRGKAQASNRLQPNASGLPEAVRITLALDPTGKAPRRAEDSGSAGSGSGAEPPLVFETVVRLFTPVMAGGGSGGSTASGQGSGSSGAGPGLPGVPAAGRPN